MTDDVERMSLEELEQRVRDLGFAIEPTAWGFKIMDDFDTSDVPTGSYTETLRDLVRYYASLHHEQKGANPS